jgi:hypothetical protein
MAPKPGQSGGTATSPERHQAFDVLDHAEALPPATQRNLAEVARRLARAGYILAVRYDSRARRLVFYRVPERLPPVLQAPSPVFKPQGRARVANGSVQLPKGDRWLASIETAGEGDQPVLLTIERKSRRKMLEPADAALVIPPGEADALLALLNGLVAQARRQGILSVAGLP